ncbi:zf-HC2 domain-containing protein [Nocardioides sp.]|uniref:zf-HC2 domain-containing protein n=1 Tax=Nocardioides sp. TaxID=35761 RepID=UPI0025D851FD|nr:zf-HC2 domain-containing protein [Nocardioides sp.]
MSTSSCEHSHLDGAYVLGALAPEERLEFERHLRECPACARAVQQLAGLPGLLSQVSADVLESTPAPVPVPDTLLPSLVREVRRGRRRRSWAAGLAAAAAVVTVVGVSVAVLTANDDDGAPSATPSISAAPSQRMTPIGTSGTTGWLTLTSMAWGTRLDLTCSYPMPEGYVGGGPPTYEMVVRTSDGLATRVASWRGVADRPITVTGATELEAADIASVEVRIAGGPRVLRLTTG